MYPLPRLAPLALACLACINAHAQTAAPAALERVSVTGTSRGLDAAAGNNSRLGLTLQQTPASVTAIDREAIEARGAANTQDILKGVPGVVAADPPGSAGSVFYRGFGSGSLAQLYNGISAQYDAIAARPVDSWIVERVEAIGGPSSFLNGSGAVGGTINVITKVADTSGDLTRLYVGGGDRAQAAASLQRTWPARCCAWSSTAARAHCGRRGATAAPGKPAPRGARRWPPASPTRWPSSASTRRSRSPTGARRCCARRTAASPAR